MFETVYDLSGEEFTLYCPEGGAAGGPHVHQYRASVQMQGSTQIGDGLTFSYRERFRLRNMETGDVFDVIVSGRAPLDETGEIIIDQQHVRASCPEVC